MYTPSLDISLRVPVRLELVWHAILDPAIRANWSPGVEFEPRPGAPIRAELVRPGKKKPRKTRGTVTVVDDDAHELHIEWVTRRGDFATNVHLLVSESRDRCKIRVIEEGFVGQNEYAEVVVAECRDGWREELVALAEYLGVREHVRDVERSLARATRR